MIKKHLTKIILLIILLFLSINSLYSFKINTKVNLPEIKYNLNIAKVSINKKELDLLYFFKYMCSVDNIKDIKQISSISCSNNILLDSEIRNIDFSLIKDNLLEIDFSNNLLTKIPEQFYTFKNLKKMNLSGNNISIIKQKISNLKYLEYLNISDNNLITFGLRPKTLTKLKYLNISNNNFKTNFNLKRPGLKIIKKNYKKVPDRIIKKTIKEIIETQKEEQLKVIKPLITKDLLIYKKIYKPTYLNQNKKRKKEINIIDINIPDVNLTKPIKKDIMIKEIKDLEIQTKVLENSIKPKEELRESNEEKDMEALIEKSNSLLLPTEEETSIESIKEKIKKRKETERKEQEFFMNLKKRN